MDDIKIKRSKLSYKTNLWTYLDNLSSHVFFLLTMVSDLATKVMDHTNINSL